MVFDWKFIEESVENSEVILQRLNEIKISIKEIQLDISVIKSITNDPMRLSFFSPPINAPHAGTRDQASLEADTLNHLAEKLPELHNLAKILLRFKKYEGRGYETLLKQLPTPGNKGLLSQLYATLYLDSQASLKILEVEHSPVSMDDCDTDILVEFEGQRVNFHSVMKGALERNLNRFHFISEIYARLSECPILKPSGSLSMTPNFDGLLPDTNSKIIAAQIELNGIQYEQKNLTDLKSIVDELMRVLSSATLSTDENPVKITIKSLNHREVKSTHTLNLSFDFFRLGSRTGYGTGIDEWHYFEDELLKRSKKIPDTNEDLNLIIYTNSQRRIVDQVKPEKIEEIKNLLDQYNKIDAVIFLDSSHRTVNNPTIVFKCSRILSRETLKDDILIKLEDILDKELEVLL